MTLSLLYRPEIWYTHPFSIYYTFQEICKSRVLDQWPTGYSNIVINVAHIGIPEDSGSRSQTTYRNKYLIDSCIFVDRHILTRSFNKKYSYLYPSMLSYSLLLINTVETLRVKPVIFTNLYPIQTCYIH